MLTFNTFTFPDDCRCVFKLDNALKYQSNWKTPNKNCYDERYEFDLNKVGLIN